mmetsp:Transcript_2993/g.12103  ORF Transcript_2993/g.12103 Transcript_2993/m.12103 type:complete len:260 (-) Transcript_2993:1493-2272(-)
MAAARRRWRYEKEGARQAQGRRLWQGIKCTVSLIEETVSGTTLISNPPASPQLRFLASDGSCCGADTIDSTPGGASSVLCLHGAHAHAHAALRWQCEGVFVWRFVRAHPRARVRALCRVPPALQGDCLVRLELPLTQQGAYRCLRLQKCQLHSQAAPGACLKGSKFVQVWCHHRQRASLLVRHPEEALGFEFEWVLPELLQSAHHVRVVAHVRALPDQCAIWQNIVAGGLLEVLRHAGMKAQRLEHARMRVRHAFERVV